MKRILSGMQPSGNPHLGNYLGAMRQHVEFQNEGECFYFIANYHALTTLRDGIVLREKTRELAIDYLALGLDPNKVAFFRQSDVPEVTELMWILSCITPMGLLTRAHAWKDKIEQSLTKASKETGHDWTTLKTKTIDQLAVEAGLLNYPILMAADILIYQSDIVPVGQDQKQHVEIARDLAQRFNHIFGETFKLPEPSIRKDVATVPGTDGQKMSKSYGNVIEIFAPADILKKQVFSIKTDSKGVAEPKDPATCLPFVLMSQLLTEKEQKALAADLVAGGIGYAALKTKLLETLLSYFGEAREKWLELQEKPDYVEDVLQAGAKKARKLARETLEAVRRKTGLA